MVPKGWTPSQVGDIAKFSSGGTPSKQAAEYWGGTEPWISGKDLKTHYLETSIDGLTKAGFQAAKKAPKGSSLVLVRGMTLLKDFPVGYATREVAFNQDLKALVPAKNIDGLFLSFLLVAEKNKILQLVSTAGHGTGRLDTHSLQEYPVNIPPLPEQKKIAQILSTWDKAITTTEQLLINSQQQKKALMQQLLTGKQRLLDQNRERFESKWREVELGSVLKEVKRPVDWDDAADYKLLSVKRRSEGVVLREVLKGTEILTKKMNIAQSGDFLISKMQIVHGAAGLVPDEFDGFHISDSYISLTPKDERKLDIHFFAWFAKQKLMYHKAFLCSYGVHIEKMTFNFKLFLKEKISVPASIEEQQKIAAVLSTADLEVAALQKKLDTFKQEKKALMQQLLTGKRRVKLN
ncbi:restriction endonuclease subunit S [Thalassolituus alkanivorans]|jgi:type I restriction enzyme S subunit|uniref:restriction endonuclease subunit S n=1 Tax=Thalassolituus alkanivorans TaxID=2881055 RepID=UPI001A14613F|nr:restriction endonuclease subunit S [Thalassolituus alkanivorans]MCB2387331.1 restriction endonuclease subunit S [Thalassolituus alkanivorans]MCB2421572.1 restriction endonuclease subunit S [Thalassolituus alkanivorans]HIM97776.1 restriction endonuclease subunit S [Gammaproteobacteria bacterium]